MIDVNPIRKNTWFVVGLVMIGVSYLAALIGCVAFFKIPLVWTFGLMLGGLTVATTIPNWLDRRLAFASSGRVHVVTNVIGSLLIVGVMVMFANSNWKSWYFHPAGFQPTWWVLVAAYFHVAGIIKLSFARTPRTDIPISDYNDEQKNNPYAPPMRTKQSTDEPPIASN